MLQVTEIAKEQIVKILAVNPGMFFRVALDGGGCAGFKYKFEITKQQEDDILIDDMVVVDPGSHKFLENATLNFKDDVFSKNFFLENPDVVDTCGCGVSIGF